MGVVIKRDGKRQAFSVAKVRRSLQMAAREAGVSASKVRELTRDVADAVIKDYRSKRVKATYLRRVILRRIDRRAKSVSAAWRRFDRKRKR